MAQMARDLSRTMSRQLGAVMETARRAARNAGRGGQGYRDVPSRASGAGMALSASGRRLAVAGGGDESVTGALAIARYRRSRIRLRARKWRLGRMRAHPIGFAIGVGVTIALLISLIGGTGAGAVYAVSYYQQHILDIDSLYNLQDAQSTVIYDRNGNVIYRASAGIGGQNIYVPLSQIGSLLQKATIDIEDHTFYSQSNIGIDFTSTGRALLADATSGGAAQGGSTITQQLVKNAILHDPTKAFQRKINEAIIAVGMTVTGRYTKAQILEMYLNSIDYGDQNIGIEAAAENYFGLYPQKNPGTGVTLTGAQQLDLAEAAMLAGIPNAPSQYQPNVYSCAGKPLPAPNGYVLHNDGTSSRAPKLDLNAKPPCPSSAWASPCVKGQDPRNLNCTLDYNYDFTTMGHEWLVYRRTEAVLNAMQQWGDITQKQHDDALNEVYDLLLYHRITSWQYVGNNFNHITDLAPHFVDYLKGYLYDNFGIENPLQSGLKIYTTLDLNLQNYAQVRAAYYINGDPRQGNTFNIPWGDYICGYGGAAADTPCVGVPALSTPQNGSNVHNAAVVAIDAHTGDILAMVGSVDYTSTDPHVLGYNNLATSPYRSMGSSTKPLVYTTAFQMGWNPGIMMQDAPICFPGTYQANQFTNTFAPNCKDWYSPTNFEQDSFSGKIPLRYGLANSLNIPATEALAFVGDSPTTSSTFIAAVRRLGINSVTANAMGPSTALGAQDISLLDLTGAYQAFADNGKHVPYRAVLAIESPTGRPLWVAPPPQAAQVISPQADYMLTSILTDQQARIPDFNSPNPLEFNDPNLGLTEAIQNELNWEGTTTDPTKNGYLGGYADNLDFPAVAAKTGTSQGITGPRDIVTMGYSPYLALGVWAGNTDPNDDLGQNIIGIAGAGYIFHDVMAWAIVHYHWPQGVQFPIPQGMALGQFNCTTGLAPYKDQKKIEACPEVPGIAEPVCPQKYPLCATRMYSGNNTRIDEDWYIQGQQWLES